MTAIEAESNIPPTGEVVLAAWQRLRVYNLFVIVLAQFVMHLLTFIFFVGLVGSSIVVVISFVEDLNELLGE
jgi:hypothetical protein